MDAGGAQGTGCGGMPARVLDALSAVVVESGGRQTGAAR